MQQLIAELTRPMVLSDRALRQLSQFKRAHSEYLSSVGRSRPEGSSRTAPVSRTRRSGTCSRSSVCRGRGRGGSGRNRRGRRGLRGAARDPLAGDAYEQLLDYTEIEQVSALMGSLNERERIILRDRYGLDGPEESLRDVGERSA